MIKSIFKTLVVLTSLTVSVVAETKPSFGWKSNPTHSKGLKQFVHHPGYTAAAKVPDLVDLSGIMPGAPKVSPVHLPSVYDQGDLGSCTANAGVAAFEFAWHKQFNTFLNGSRLGLYTCSTMHDGNWPQDAGSYTSTVVWVVKNQGLGKESCFPYSKKYGTPLPKCYLPEAAKSMAINAYDVNSADHVSVKVALANGFPVMFGGYVYNAIQTLNATNYFEPPHNGQGRPIGGHERLIVGYNSKLTRTFNGRVYTGFYWVRNSWGVSWGYRGHSWIPMAEIENPAINEDFAVISAVVKK